MSIDQFNVTEEIPELNFGFVGVPQVKLVQPPAYLTIVSVTSSASSALLQVRFINSIVTKTT